MGIETSMSGLLYYFNYKLGETLYKDPLYWIHIFILMGKSAIFIDAVNQAGDPFYGAVENIEKC